MYKQSAKFSLPPEIDLQYVVKDILYDIRYHSLLAWVNNYCHNFWRRLQIFGKYIRGGVFVFFGNLM